MIKQAALVAVAAISVASCGATTSSLCSETREPSDPASFLHVIEPGAAVFLTDPPTSGPHVSGSLPTGVVDSAIEPAIQVSILESGSALIQYSPEITADDLTAVLALAGPSVVVAPGINLPSVVVATAWTWKLTCSTPDIEALSKFADRRPIDAPGSD